MSAVNATRRTAIAAAAGIALALPVAGTASATTQPTDPLPVRIDGGSNGERTVFSGAFLTEPSKEAPADIVLGFVRAHHEDFGLTQSEAKDLRVERSHVSASGTTRVVLEQWFAGSRVHNARLVGTVDGDGRLVMVSGRTAATDSASGEVDISVGEAIVIAAEEAGAEDVEQPTGSLLRSTREFVFENTIAEGLRDPEPLRGEQRWFITDGGLRLVWVTEVESSSSAWFQSAIDAETGAVLEMESRYSHAGPEGTVFTGQHPDDSPARTIVPFTGVDGSWVDGTTTSGNNVNAYRDLDDSNAIGYQPTDADQHFNFTFTDAWRGLPDGTDLVDQPAADVTAALDADLDAIITQLFYYTNDMHDWLWGYGFDEASGNFQVVNHSGDGIAGDAVFAEAQDGFDFGCVPNPQTNPPSTIRCLNNANFGTAADGSTARMQMYIFARPNRPYRDGSLDGDVIAHEYGHGVSNRLVPGTLSNAINQAGSLGEGWSDAISFLRWGDTTVGEYVTGDAGSGIRNFAYDTHPWTYGDYSTAVISPHRNGEIWAAAMFEIRDRLGINATTQLVLDGMRSTGNGPSPTFLDARDGILGADLADNGGANRCALWSAFAASGMGIVAVSNGLHAVPTENMDIPVECRPSADAGGPYSTDEGVDVEVSASGSSAGTDPSAGAIVSYAWDLDNDGQYDDATGVTADFTRVGQDGAYPIGVQVTDEWGNTATDSGVVNVANVLPTVTLNAIPPIDEHGTTTISGVVSDPGWLELLTATIDFDDGEGPQPLTGVLENVRPDATLTFSVEKQYGDNGVFTVVVTGTDDHGDGTDSANAVVTNVDPTAAIDGTDMVEYGGQSAFLAKAGEPVDVPVDSTDPGSDDLTVSWDWGDGTVTSQTSLVNPPALDPAKSPSVQPRDISLTSTHTFGDACLYELTATVEDDDGGTASDTAAIVIRGNATASRSTGWWLNQMRVSGANTFTTEELDCLLDIVGFYSTVFPSGMDRADAVSVLHDPAKNDARTRFDEVALASWLNFANGARDFDDPVRPTGQKGTGSTWGAVMLAAEQVRMNPASTQKQINDARTVLGRML